MRRTMIGAATLALAMVGAGTAGAVTNDDNDANRDNDRPHVDITVDGDEVAVDFDNPSNFFFSFDVRVDGEAGVEDDWSGQIISEGPLAGQDFGLRYTTVDLAGGLSTSQTYTAEEQVEVRLARGAEQNWYFDWIVVEVEDDGSDESDDGDDSDESEDDEHAALKALCRDGGYEDFGFKNQGRCIASIVADENAAVHDFGDEVVEEPVADSDPIDDSDQTEGDQTEGDDQAATEGDDGSSENTEADTDQEADADVTVQAEPEEPVVEDDEADDGPPEHVTSCENVDGPKGLCVSANVNGKAGAAA